jgi:hypothetical protein
VLFSTAFFFLNEIQYKASFESISFSTLDIGIDFAKNAKNEPILYSIAIELLCLSRRMNKRWNSKEDEREQRMVLLLAGDTKGTPLGT